MSMNFFGYTYFLKEVIEFKPKESLCICVWQKLIMEMYATAFKFKDEWVAFIINIPIVCQEFWYQVMSCNFDSPTTIFKISCEISISSYLTNYNTTGFECDFQGVIIAFALGMWGTKRFLIISTPDHTWLMDMCSGEVVIHYSLQLLSKENTSSNGENPIPCVIQWGTH